MAAAPSVAVVLAYAMGAIALLVASLGFLKSGGGEGWMLPSFNVSDLIVDADHLQEQVRCLCRKKYAVISAKVGGST